MLKTCPNCQGTKKVKGLGMMRSECPVCEAVGKLDSEKIKPIFRPAAVPLARAALPDDYYRQQQAKKTAGLENANCAYKNYPQNFVPNKDTQNTPGADKPQSIVKQLTPADIVELKTQIAPRDDDIGKTKVTLSAAMQEQLKEIARAKLEAEQAAQAAETIDTIADNELDAMFDAKCQTSEATVASAKIVTPVVTKSVAKTEVKRGRQKAAKN